MKTIIVLLLVLVATSAGAGERYPMSSSNCLWDENGKLTTIGGENCGGYMEDGRYVEESCTPCPQTIERFSWTMNEIAIAKIEPVKQMSFSTGYNEEAGTLTWEGGVFKFSGDPDKSAQVFLDWLQQHYNTRQELYCEGMVKRLK